MTEIALVACERMGARLTKASCVKRWASSRNPVRLSDTAAMVRETCSGCEVGAVRAKEIECERAGKV